MTFTCPSCEKKFNTMNGFGGHRRWCVPTGQSFGNYPAEAISAEVDDDDFENVGHAVDNACDLHVLMQQESILKSCSLFSAELKDGCVLSLLLKIYLFGEKTSLSVSEGSELLDLVRSSFPGPISDAMPLSYETLKVKIDSYSPDLFRMKRTIVKFPPNFSSHDINVYEGHYLNILTLIGDMMLEISADDLHLQPLLLRHHSDSRVLREPASGLDFENMFNYVTETYGVDVIPLPVTVAIDELALNKLGSRGAKPAYIQLASRKADKYWGADNIRCVGFSPTTQVSYVYGSSYNE